MSKNCTSNNSDYDYDKEETLWADDEDDEDLMLNEIDDSEEESLDEDEEEEKSSSDKIVDNSAADGTNLKFKSIDYTTEDLYDIVADYASGDQALKQKAYIKMCKILSAYVTTYISSNYNSFIDKHGEDMRSAAFIGIMEGLGNYDPSKGMPTTWFSIYIKKEVDAYINGIKNTTAHYAQAENKLKKVIEEKERRGVSYNILDLAVETRMSLKTIAKIQQTNIANNSIAIETGSIVTNSLKDDTMQPEKVFLKREEEQFFYDLLYNEDENDPNRLTDAERDIALYRFGFIGDKGLGVAKIAKILGIDENKAKSLNRSMSKKLKNALKGRRTFDWVETDDYYNSKKYEHDFGTGDTDAYDTW